MLFLLLFHVGPPPPLSLNPHEYGLDAKLCKGLCYCWSGKSYSPYLKTCEVDSPAKVQVRFMASLSTLNFFTDSSLCSNPRPHHIRSALHKLSFLKCLCSICNLHYFLYLVSTVTCSIMQGAIYFDSLIMN